jgi:hypothetical protein
MKTHSRLVPGPDFPRQHTKPGSLPIDTRAKRGIYSLRLEFCHFVLVATGVANGRWDSGCVDPAGFAIHGSPPQPRLYIKPLRRSHAPGNKGFSASLLQGRSDFGFCPAGRPAPQIYLTNNFLRRGRGLPFFSVNSNLFGRDQAISQRFLASKCYITEKLSRQSGGNNEFERNQ